MTTPIWVKGVAVAVAFCGAGFGFTVAFGFAALADGVTVARSDSQTVGIEPGGTVTVDANSASLKIVVGPAGEVRIDEHDSVRALTRRLASLAVARLNTAVETTTTGVRVTPSTVSFQTFAGYEERQITIHAPSDVALVVDVASGSLDASGFRGDISVVAESGSVKLRDLDVTGKVTAHVVSGSINFRGAITGGQVDLSTISGSVDAQVPTNSNLHYQASTVSGAIALRTDRRYPFPIPRQDRSTSGDLGSGGPATLTMSAISGNVTLSVY